ncbi:hypothetical protein PAP18089_01425 [Pandoraea apista]|uniref:Uncharacterized protein n=1 Tax=Pandoraea apista TaxID=93218 RepID=A0A5E5P2G7_9BURK|nr:hypothetical protein PAP18089_01425 [Pandoraea apista]
MCGRYSRGQGDLFYVVPLATDENDPRLRGHADLFRPSWNVSPGTQHRSSPPTVHVCKRGATAPPGPSSASRK